jgi:superfamily II DNA helicase RecQ
LQYRVFSIRATGGESATEELNQFLRGHRVTQVRRGFVSAGEHSWWSICVGYDAPAESNDIPSKRGRLDYREILDPPDFAVFSALRDLRRDIAQREGVPPYTLFTNEHLAAMVTGRVTTRAGLAALDGVGEARLEKYAEPFLSRLEAAAQRGWRSATLAVPANEAARASK